MSSAAKRARSAGGSVVRHPPAPPAVAAAGDPAALQAWHHGVYFESYAHLAIHQEMLRDEARTLAYRDAMLACADDIRGKVVLDVGAGTGVLSIFAARAGARHVYAVEASALAEQTRAVVAANGLSDTITVLQSKVEDAELPEQVDVIVSEWMGYALLYENMLGSVLAARDKWLRPGGLMMPSHATLWCAPVTDEDRHDDAVRFWDDVYGIDMRVLAPLALKCAFAEPVVESFPPQNVMTWPVPLRRLDLAALAPADVLPWEGRFEAASLVRAPCHGVAIWFDVEFHSAASAKAAAALPPQPLGRGAPARVPPPEAAPRVRLRTGPDDPVTHWMTTLLYVEQPRPTQQDGRICGSLRMAPHAANERFLQLRLAFDAADDGSAPAVEKTFEMV